MNAKVETSEFQYDLPKWIVVFLLVIGASVANSYYSEVALLYRVLALVGVGLVACFIAVNTAKGNSFWELLKSSQTEIRKVVWPTRQETIQTTMIVVAVVIVMAIILWALDNGLGFLASKVIG